MINQEKQINYQIEGHIITIISKKDYDRNDLLYFLKNRLGYFNKYLILCKQQKGLINIINKMSIGLTDQKICKLLLVKLITDFVNNSFMGEEGDNIFLNETYAIKGYKKIMLDMARARITKASISEAQKIVLQIEDFNKKISLLFKELEKKEKSLEVEKPLKPLET